MAWLELLLAGGLEVFWSTFMKLSEGFTRPLYTVLTLIGLALSFLFLSQATRVLPLGPALVPSALWLWASSSFGSLSRPCGWCSWSCC